MTRANAGYFGNQNKRRYDDFLNVQTTLNIKPSFFPNDIGFLNAIRFLCFHFIDSPTSNNINRWVSNNSVYNEIMQCLDYISAKVEPHAWRIDICPSLRGY